MSKNSDVQNTDSETVNTIAIAAVSISIAAFLVAYLQLLLGSSLTSSALWKTNRAALGSLVHQRSWRLAMKRVKVTYPEISFNLGDLIAAAEHSSRSGSLVRFANRLGMEWSTNAPTDGETSDYVRYLPKSSIHTFD
jgi:hypothetical protein